MKKSMKKITAVLSAAIMCALPMAGSFSTTANATDFVKKKSYRTYVDFTKKTNAQANFRVLDLEFFTYKPLEVDEIKRGKIGGYFSQKNGSGSQYGVMHHREWKAGGQPNNGTVLTVLTDVDDDSVWEFNERTVIRAKAKTSGGAILSSIEVPVNSTTMEHMSGCLSIETVLVGDANNDKVIDVRDAVLVARCASGDDTVVINERAADVDGDGQVTDSDRVTLLEYIVDLYNFSDIQ